MHRKSPANISGIPVWVVRSAILLAIVLGGYLTFEFGRIQAGYNIVDEFEERRAYENRIQDLARRSSR
ncbi:MAG: hypothetical protein U5K38_03980 [Woeseiaceae bacterium]|nr:hypothetical protein [Woeseiaceae bacterium]